MKRSHPTRIIAVALAAAFGARRVPAQAPILPTTPRFQEIVRLAQDGYGDSARTLIAHIMSRAAQTDSNYAEMLYTAGSVARSGDSMRSDFARIVVEYPASPWADKASLRLVQLEYGAGNMDNVMSRVTRLLTDYPGSLVIPAATLWGARAAFDLQKPQQACDWITRGLASVGDDLELRNQLQFAKQRCAIGNGVQFAPVAPDSLRAGPPPTDTAGHHGQIPPPPAPAPAPPPAASHATTQASPWRVQVIAIADKAVIHRMIQKIEAAGFRAYTVPGPRGLTKVQAGPFTTRAAAVAQLARIKHAVGGSPFVTTAP